MNWLIHHERTLVEFSLDEPFSSTVIKKKCLIVRGSVARLGPGKKMKQLEETLLNGP